MMPSKQHHISLTLLLSIVTYCSCASLGGSSDGSNDHLRRFGHTSLTPGNFQSWQDWRNKRIFGGAQPKFGQWSGTSGSLGTGDFQDWRAYMSKRGFQVPDSTLGHQHFQSWMDWSKRRGLGGGRGTPFPSDGSFQTWHDWRVKRDSPFAKSGAPFGKDIAGMQSWGEFMKRKGFGINSPHVLGGMTPGMQSWNEWKRMGGLSSSGGRWGSFGQGSSGLGDKSGMMDWESLYNRSPSKRNSWVFAPRQFGSSDSHLTSGLQDWGSQFKANKRSVSDEETAGDREERSAEKQDSQQ